MKHLNSSRLWITLILLLSCVGAFYFTNLFTGNTDITPLTDEVVASTISEASETVQPLADASPLSFPQNLEGFDDSIVLKHMPNLEAMSLLVSHGKLRPALENSFLPNADVSIYEFLEYAMNWLKSVNDHALPNHFPKPLTLGNICPAAVATGEAVTLDTIAGFGFADNSQLILDAAGYDIPLFSLSAKDYNLPIQRNQAACILLKLLQNALSEEVSLLGNLEDYMENAFSLRLDPYYAEIGNAFALGLFSVEEFPTFVAEMPVSRAQTADLLMRLFNKERRIQNPVRIREQLRRSNNYHSKAIYLFNNNTKNTVFAFNEEQLLVPASLTKIMTVSLAIDLIGDIKSKVAVAPAFRQRMLRSGASIAGFYGNEKVTYEDLLYATFLSSGAEAAGTLAIHLAGSEEAFISLMNRKAKNLGMKNTHFRSVEGLDTPGQYTTARDIVLLLESALQNPTFYQIATTATYQTSRTRFHPRGLKLQSTVLRNISPEEETGFQILGGKSGTTAGAGLCWATFAHKNGNLYILVTLGAPLDNIYRPTMYQKMDALKIYRQIGE